MFLRKKGIKQTNVLLGLLLILYSLTLLNALMAMTGVYSAYQNLYFLPLVFTLSIGPLFYLFVKSRVHASFRISKKDIIHFILPSSQFLFYLFISVQSAENKSRVWRTIIEPYVQYIEEVLVLTSCIGYVAYSIFLLNRNIPKSLMYVLVNRWLKKFALSLLILLLISSLYEIVDWILWGKYEINLFNIPWADFPLKMTYAIISLIIGYNSYLYQNQSLITNAVYEKGEDDELNVHILNLLVKEKVFLR